MEFIKSLDASLLLPIALISSPIIYYAYSKYTSSVAAAEVQRTGIGRGAPGFKTGVARVALPVEIVARIRMGEEVTAEEITEAIEVEKEKKRILDEAEAKRLAREAAGKKKIPDTVDESWLEGTTVMGSGSNGRRRKK